MIQSTLLRAGEQTIFTWLLILWNKIEEERNRAELCNFNSKITMVYLLFKLILHLGLIKDLFIITKFTFLFDFSKKFNFVDYIFLQRYHTQVTIDIPDRYSTSKQIIMIFCMLDTEMRTNCIIQVYVSHELIHDIFFVAY